MSVLKSTLPKDFCFSKRVANLSQVRVLVRALAEWYARHRRRLPWRTHPSLYGTVVSEFMLQQTQIATALPYFERWMAKFPDFETLANSQESEVLKHWEGLGYYSRARNLHAVAKEIVSRGEALPQKAAQWLALKGIGPYTAAAIASIAQGERVGLVDGNVVRVLARLRGDRTVYASASAAGSIMQPAADFLASVAPDVSVHNQAMMELGALVCTKNRPPECLLCPVRNWCTVCGLPDARNYPFFKPRSVQRVQKQRLWIIDAKGRLLLHRVHASAKRLAKLWELPLLEDLPAAKAQRKPIAIKRRSISQQQITESIFAAALASEDTPKGEEWIWADRKTILEIALSGPHRRWIEGLFRELHQ